MTTAHTAELSAALARPNVRRDFTPVSADERVVELDVLRGFALFGILIVNILDYAPPPTSNVDRITGLLINIFADGSFYPLFSLLFGIGFALFLERASARGANGILLYIRRLAALLVIAVLQIVLLEDRNILVRYSLLALPLLLFRRASARACFVAGVVSLALAIGRGPLNRALTERQMRDPGSAAAIRASRATDRALGAARETESRRVAATHSYRAFAAFRAQWQVQSQLAWSTDLRRNPSLFHILAMFLFGAAAWRSRLLVDRTRLTRVRLWGVLVGSGIFGVAGNLAVSMGPRDGPIQALAAFPTTTTLITVLANTALTLTYVSAGILLLRGDRDAWRSRLAPLASIGRMALTNYLMQSVAMSLLFLPYGLRLGHELQLWTYPLIGVAIFASHFPLSIWWLRRYRFGPVEWAWRTMTYGRLQPMRLADGQMTFGAEPSGTPE